MAGSFNIHLYSYYSGRLITDRIHCHDVVRKKKQFWLCANPPQGRSLRMSLLFSSSSAIQGSWLVGQPCKEVYMRICHFKFNYLFGMTIRRDARSPAHKPCNSDKTGNVFQWQVLAVIWKQEIQGVQFRCMTKQDLRRVSLHWYSKTAEKSMGLSPSFSRKRFRRSVHFMFKILSFAVRQGILNPLNQFTLFWRKKWQEKKIQSNKTKQTKRKEAKKEYNHQNRYNSRKELTDTELSNTDQLQKSTKLLMLTNKIFA